MTLRGSVASFPLETVVQLLAATAKTGQLEVRSGRESGTLGFAEGRLVSAVTGDDAGDAALGAVFTIQDGDFEFVPWGEPPEANLAGDLSQLLDRAVVQRDKIVADRQVISDDRVRFGLSDRAAAQGDVRLSAEQWRALLAVNGERDLPAIAKQLRLGRLATLAMLADLVRAGIVEVRDAPPEPSPSGPGSGTSGGGAGSDKPSFAAAPPVREVDRPRSETAADTANVGSATVEPVFVAPVDPPVTQPEPEVEPVALEPDPQPAASEPEPALQPEPTASTEPEPRVAAAWEQPPPIPPREARVWGEPAIAPTPGWEQPVSRPAVEPEKPSWDNWDSPTSAVPAEPAPQSAPPQASWDAPVEETRAWQPSSQPTQTERDWGLPAQDWETGPSRAAPQEPRRPETARADAAGKDTVADRSGTPERDDLAAPAAPGADRTMDDRLSALSGLFGTSEARPATPAWPAAEPRAASLGAPVAETQQAPAAEEAKKKGGLFSGLFKKDEKKDEIRERLATATAPAGQSGSRVPKLAGFANALLDEYNNGQYGKGRLDDRIANLLMRVDEQADPIDRPLPVIDDRIDVHTLERANMSERQVAPYLALLVSQIYQDAEHTFGKDKAKRGYKTVQTTVIGNAAALGTDLRLPRV